MKLHETIKNFYIKCFKPLFTIEVLANGKWNKIDSINVTEKQTFYEVKTKNHKLLCTKNHILIGEDGEEFLAVDSKGKKTITDSGIETIESVVETSIFDNAYDLSLSNASNHLYNTNGMLSHNCVILDEFAFLQKNIADKLFTSMYPVISSSKNGKFILVSTPNGTDNLYYDIWCQANSKEIGKNLEGWKAFTMWWWQVPGHDEAWKQKQIAAIGKTRFAQEFNNEFLVSSTIKKLIPDDILEQYRIHLSEYKSRGITSKKQKILSSTEDELYEFDMWHEFQPNRTYLASGDISEGVGGDSSVLYIWDVTNLQQITLCAKFSSNTVSLVQFAYICNKILALYNNPWLFAERNGVSAGMIDSLRITYGYQNIASENKKNEPGIYSHIQVKSKACLWARDMMTTKGFGFIIYDKELLDEMGIFVKKDVKGVHNVYHAAPGPNSHDDHMLAFIWCCYGLSLDIIEKYFVVCETFVDELGQLRPKTLQPLEAYLIDDIQKLQNDPLYKDFIEFKNESQMKLQTMLELEHRDISNDSFKYRRRDPYFGDISEDDWSNTPLNWNMQRNPNNANYPFSLGSSMHQPSFFVI